MRNFLAALAVLGALHNFIFAGELQERLDKAAESADKRVFLEPRTYMLSEPLMLGARHSGISLIGAENGATTVSLGAKIEGWTPEGGNVWKARVEGENCITSLYINGVRATPAQTPNNDFFFVYDKVPSQGVGGSRAEFVAENLEIAPLLDMPATELSNVRIDVYMSWIHQILTIEKIVRGEKTSTIRFNKPASSTAFYRFDSAPRFKIVNCRAALDKAGEFFFDKNSQTVFYIPRKGENMASASSFYGLSDSAIVASGDSVDARIANISIKNITFEYGSCRPDFNSESIRDDFFGVSTPIKPRDGVSWANSGQGATSSSAFIKFDFAKNITIENCTVRHIDGYAIEFGKSVWDSCVKNCELFDIGTGGVRIGTPKVAAPSDNPERDALTSGRIKVQNNIICKYGRWHKSGVGVLAFDVAGIEILHNDIFDGYYSGVSTGWVWGSGKTHTAALKINFNRIHDLSYGFMSDLGGIYTLGTSPDSEIVGNVIHSINCHRYGGWGIYNDEGSKGFLVSKNYVSQAQEGGYFMHYGSDCTVVNNLLCDAADFQIGLGRQGKNSFKFERNIVVYSSPAILLRNNNAPEIDSVAFDKNIYFNRTGEVMFGNMTFAQWQKSGRDLHSFVESVDINKILAGASVDKIGFEPLDTKSAGVTGDMQRRLAQILENYKFPKVRRTLKESPRAKLFSDDFSADIVGKKPAEPYVSGDSITVIEDPQTGRAMRAIDMPSTPDWLPYFYYKCKFSEKSLAKLSFKIRLSQGSCISFDIRNGEANYGKGPRLILKNAKLDGNLQLPIGKWLDVRFEIPVLDPDSKGIYVLSIFDGDKQIFREARTCPNQTFDNFTWVGCSMVGTDSSTTDFASFKLE